MTRNRSGSTDGGFKQNEVQALIVPADFNLETAMGLTTDYTDCTDGRR